MLQDTYSIIVADKFVTVNMSIKLKHYDAIHHFHHAFLSATIML